LVTGALISGQVTVFERFLSRKSKHSLNLYPDSKLSQGNNSTNQSIPVNEGSFTDDQILRFISGGGDAFLKRMSISFKWSRQVAGRALCNTVTKWMPGVKILFTVIVWQFIIYVSNQLETGEIKLIETTSIYHD